MSETSTDNFMLVNSFYHHTLCLFYVGGSSMYVFVVDIDIHVFVYFSSFLDIISSFGDRVAS